MVSKFGYTLFCILLSILIHHYCYFDTRNLDAGSSKPVIFLREFLRLFGCSYLELTDSANSKREFEKADVKIETDDEIINIKKTKVDHLAEISNFKSFLEKRAYVDGEYELLKTFFEEKFDKRRGYLMLAIADKNYADFTTNFAIRVQQLKLKAAFICLDEEVRLHLARVGETCHLVRLAWNDGIDAAGNGNFYSDNYIAITNLKTLFTATALYAGFDTLQTDVDVSFFKDPAPYLRRQSDVDALVTLDREMANSGFDLIAATHNSKLWYAKCWNKYQEYPKGRHQIIWNGQMKHLENGGHLKVVSLSVELFPCGAFYFSTDRREFAGDRGDACPLCVAVHNNYVGSIQAKRYRMRETGLWILPRPDKSRRNYLAASFVWSYGCEDVSTAQRRGLSHALRLASSTGRVLILPRFRCCPYSKRPRNKKPVPSATGNMGCANELAECSLMHVLNIAVFEEHVGQDGYRENTFLLNKLGNLKVSEILFVNDITKDHEKFDVLNVKWRMDRIEKLSKVKGGINDLSDEKYSTSSYEQFSDDMI